MIDRFYLPDPWDGDRLQLAGPEAHHLVRVLRGKVGDQVCLFDGIGGEARAEVVAIERNVVHLRVLERSAESSAGRRELILGCAVPKGDRFRWIVEKATELGVSRLVPLQAAHSVVDPGLGKLTRMQHTVIAACKQCGRNRLMQIDAPIAWEIFVRCEFPHRASFVASQEGMPLARVAAGTIDRDAPLVMVIGPEGGLTADEVQLARDFGATLVSLGQYTLRIETAVVAAATILQACFLAADGEPATH